MRERQFIEQNKEKWKEFEELVNKKESDPEKLGKLFVQITDDLSYARTFYPNRSVRVYLNNLAQSVFDKLYKSRKKKKNRVTRFFNDEIPSAVFYAKKELLLSLAIFVISVLIGIYSAIQNPDFTKSILSEEYVEMTETNIENNDAMAVYKGDNQLWLFAQLARNNLAIDFKTFVSGLAFGLWTILMLVSNGVMVGAFQFFFAERGLFSESFLTIWMHGTLELSAAVIAGGAGLILGRGLVFPGTYSRLQSLMIAAKQGLKILLIAVCMTTFAAFIESFVTRYTEMHNAVRLIWISLSFAFVIGYFIVLPSIKWKRGTILPKPIEKLQEDLNFNLEVKQVKSIGTLFSDAFGSYRKTLSNYLIIIFSISLIYTALNVFFNYTIIQENFTYFMEESDESLIPLAQFVYAIAAPIIWTYTNLGSIFSISEIDLRLLFNGLLLMVAISFSFGSFHKLLQKNELLPLGIKVDYKKLAGLSIVLTIIILTFAFLPNSWIWILLLSPIPFILLFASGILLNESIASSLNVSFANFWLTYALYLSFSLICTLIFTLLTSVIFHVFFSFGNMLFDVEGLNAYKVYVAVYIFFSCFSLMFIMPPIIYGFIMTYFANKESLGANGLKEKLRFLNSNESVEV